MGKKSLFRHQGKSSFPAMGRALSIFAVFLVLAGMVHGMEHAGHFDHAPQHDVHYDVHQNHDDDDAPHDEPHYAEDDCLASMLSADIVVEARVSFAAWPIGKLPVSQNVGPQGDIITGFCARAPPSLI